MVDTILGFELNKPYCVSCVRLHMNSHIYNWQNNNVIQYSRFTLQQNISLYNSHNSNNNVIKYSRFTLQLKTSHKQTLANNTNQYLIQLHMYKTQYLSCCFFCLTVALSHVYSLCTWIWVIVALWFCMCTKYTNSIFDLASMHNLL